MTDLLKSENLRLERELAGARKAVADMAAELNRHTAPVLQEAVRSATVTLELARLNELLYNAKVQALGHRGVQVLLESREDLKETVRFLDDFIRKVAEILDGDAPAEKQIGMIHDVIYTWKRETDA